MRQNSRAPIWYVISLKEEKEGKGSQNKFLYGTQLQTHRLDLAFYPVITSVQLLGVTLQFHAPEQRDTAKDVLLFLVQHSGTHSHCLFVIHHWH